MNRFLCSLSLLLTLATLPFLAYGEEVESNAHILVTAGRTFSHFTVTESVTGGFYAQLGLMGSVRSNAMSFGYFGPEFTFSSKTNLKVLTGTWMTKEGGISAISSLWLTQPMPGDFTIFLEGDAYFPIDGDGGNTGRAYYTFASLDWFPEGNTVGLGVVQENFFTEKLFEEAAMGPALLFDNSRIWLAYDISPDLPGSQVYLRLVLPL